MLFQASPIVAATMAMSVTASAAPTNTTKPDFELSTAAKLQLVDTVAERYNILSDDKDFVYDLGQNGGQAIANIKTFPALVGTRTSIAAAKFPGCSISKLHIHPRADELLVLLSGRLMTETVPELGSVDSNGKQRVIHNELLPNMLNVFHQGALHTQVNPDCEEATALTVFSAEDGGFGFVADQSFALPDDIIATQLGDSISGADVDRIRSSLPQGLVAMIEDCLQKCNIPKRQVV